MFRFNECLVYHYVETIPENSIFYNNSVQWRFVDSKDIDVFFSTKPLLKKTFLNFLRQGFIGIVLFQENNWATYCWMTTPSTKQPPHLPAWVRHLNAYWLFYSHTHEEYRGRGFYKLALQLLIKDACEREIGGLPKIYADTDAQNIPPRHTLLSLGFQPSGILNCYKFGIPKLLTVTWGKWHKEREHPPLLKSGVVK